MQKKRCFKGCLDVNKNNLSLTRHVVGNLPHPNTKAEDPRQKPSGMTLNLMGFTLIELLVVVLIIGILAAVALPQYQKVVDKARLAEAFVLGKHFKQMEEMYKLANGTYTGSFEELSIDIPKGYTFQSQFPYMLSKGGSSFQMERNRIIYSYKPKGTDYVALFFWFDTGADVNSGKIHCYPYTSYGQKLCGSLPL